MGLDLFGDDGEEEEEDRGEVIVNEKFAKELEEREEKRLKMKEAALGMDEDDDSEEDSETEDEEAEELTEALDLQIVKTINAIRRKDAKIYQSETSFFEAPASETEMLSTDDDDDDDDDEESAVHSKRKDFAYDAEQESLRKAVALGLNSADQSEHDDELIVRSKSSSEKKNQTALELEEELKDFEALGSETKEEDAYLAEFSAKRKWQISQPNKVSAGKQYKNTEDDDSDYEDVEAFEAAYNFRFEQGDTSIATYSRPKSIDNSLRREEPTKRKEKRQKKKRDLDLLEKQRLDELRHIRNRQKKELEAQQKILKKEAGLADDYDADDLLDDQDFDPEAHDQRMSSLFNDDYYGAPESDEKPVFLDDDKELEALTKMEIRGKIFHHEKTENPDKTQRIEADFSVGRHEEESFDSTQRYTTMPFRYKQVEPNDFGLTTDEILQADDRALRQLVSIKKIAPYRESEYKVKADKRKKWRQEYMKKKNKNRPHQQETETSEEEHRLSDSFLHNTKEEEEEKTTTNHQDDDDNIVTAKKRVRKRKKSAKSHAHDLEPRPEATTTVTDKKKKKKKRTSTKDAPSSPRVTHLADSGTNGAPPISKSRLASYGF